MAVQTVSSRRKLVEGRRDRFAEKVQQMYAAYQEGRSLSEVGSMFGLTKQAVHQMFSKRGLLRRTPIYKEFNGKQYAKDRAYWVAADGSRLHRDIWEFHNGTIPSGMVIHHVDGDPENNAIENLQCVTPSQHKRIHVSQQCPVYYRKKCLLCGKEMVRRLDKSPKKFRNQHLCSWNCRNRFFSKFGKVSVKSAFGLTSESQRP